MKKYWLLLLIVCFLVSGCGNYNQKDIVKDFSKKLEDSSGYKLSGNLVVNNNDESYTYKIEVGYKKENFYKVILRNELSDSTQIILKNSDGVYVITPALNKSFKFQSDWPYNNSQIYLLDALNNDLDRDKERKFKLEDNKYIFTTKVKYPNNSKLVKQKIYMNKKFKIDKVIVYDKDGIQNMVMDFDRIDYSPSFSKDYFSLDKIVTKGEIIEEEKDASRTANMNDVIYPLFLPNGTKLVNEEKIKTDSGERVIMNYDGEKSFLLVEETADVFNEFTVIPASGEPFQLLDSLGVMTNNSLSWVSNGIEYYLVSDVMNNEEMIEVAQSIGGVVSYK